MGPTCQSNYTLSSSVFYSCNYWTSKIHLISGRPKLRAPPSADELAHSRRPSMPLPMAAPKLARAALSKLSHGRSRLSRRVSPVAPSSMLLLRADELAHGLRPSRSHPDPLNLASHLMSSPTVAAANLDELAKGQIRCVPGRGHLRARRKTLSRLLAPYCEPGMVILRASTWAGMRAARSGVWRAAAFGGRS